MHGTSTTSPAPRSGRMPPSTPADVIEQGMATQRARWHAHVAFVRFVLEGKELGDAWQRCFDFAGGVDDLRDEVALYA